MTTEYLLILIFIYLNTFIMGFQLGRYSTSKVSLGNNYEKYSQNNKPKQILTENEKVKLNKVQIDTSLYVTDVGGQGVVKYYDSLGETKIVNDNINEDINQLNKLKKR
jgi:hypothetical protein